MTTARFKRPPFFLAWFCATCFALPSFAQEKDLGAEFIDGPQTEDVEVFDAAAVDVKDHAGYLPGYRQTPALGLSPYVPQQFASLPGGVTPQFGAPVADGTWRFDFHGYLQQPFVAGIGEREQAFIGQKTTTIHGDPVVAGGSYGFFDHSQTVPTPWAQLNFYYGNDVVKVTTIIGAWSNGQSQYSAGYYQPPSQVWFNDVFLTYAPDIGPVGLSILIGAYPDRYGPMAKYTSGAYGVAFLGQLNGVGTTGTLSFPFENGVTLSLEGGFKGDFNKTPVGIVPDPSNEFAREAEGSTWGVHEHLTLDYQDVLRVSGHYIYTFSQDDRIDESVPFDADTTQPHPMDGFIRTRGIDARLDAARYGYAYLGLSEVRARNSYSVSNLLSILNTGSGRDLTERYWGFPSNGNGDIRFIGGQYSLSLGTLLRYPQEFYGDGPDIQISAFGIYGTTDSQANEFDQNMFKWGLEATYSMLPWLAASLRADHILPELDDNSRTFGVISPKLVFRNDWQTQASVTLQYAGYLLGENTRAEGDNRLQNTPSGNPDKHLVAIFGTMWW